MNRLNSYASAAMVACLVAAPAAAAQNTNGANSNSAVKVNGTTIPQYRIDAAIKSRTAQGQPDTPENRKGIRDALVNQEIVAQELSRRDVHAGEDRRLDVERLLPGREFPGRAVEGEEPEVDDEPGLLGDRDEVRRRHGAEPRMAPPQ